MDSVQQTIRVTGLPTNASKRDVEQHFNERVDRKHGRQRVELVGPICDHSTRVTKRTTVSFSSHKTAVKALSLEETSRRLVAEAGGAETITLDHSFRDLTTLHTSNNPTTGKPDIDIVAVHGLRGHAWNSFTTSSSVNQGAGRTKETNWLRDIMPRLLEQNTQQSIHSRVMTFGYDADVWMTKSVAEIDSPVNTLLAYLDTERHEDPERPLFFIGHSLGGIVIKQVIVAFADNAMIQDAQRSAHSTERYNFPVKGCMLFGVPNQGTEAANTASKVLTGLSTLFKINRNIVRDLKDKSQRLANIASQFRQVRYEHSIPVFSFYELQNYSSTLGLIVNKESAVIEYPGYPPPIGIDRNHKEMAKFSNDGAHALEPAIDFLAKCAREAILAQRRRQSATPLPSPSAITRTHQENRYSILENYDTVFLVDDSPSMAGERWELVKKILDYSTAVAMKYDPDGVDIHFLNNRTANQDNVGDPAFAVEILRNIALRGNTPIRDQLSRHLHSYLREYERRKNDLNVKGYNLILLTDGEPNPDYDAPGDIFDLDAERTKPAFRRIRKMLVEIAQQLDNLQAEENQVGIQFCNVGNDPGAEEFFNFLDNRLQGQWNLNRDMIDTVSCKEEADLDVTFFENLLLGGIDKVVDNRADPARSQPVPSGPANGGQSETTRFEPSQHHSMAYRPRSAAIVVQNDPWPANSKIFSGQYTHQPFEPRPSGMQAPREARASHIPPAASTPRFTPQPSGYRERFEPPQPRRQTTDPPAELPMQPTPRSNTSGPAKAAHKGWPPWS